MENDLLQKLQPAIASIVAFWQAQLVAGVNPQSATLDVAANRLLQPGNDGGAMKLAYAAGLAAIARENLPPLTDQQVSAFGQALHQSIEKILRQETMNRSTSSLSLGGGHEYIWSFGLDYILEGTDAFGEVSCQYQDVPLFHAGRAIGLDPKVLRFLFPWQTKTELRYGLAVERVMVIEHGKRRVLWPDWMITVMASIQESWDTSRISSEKDEIEAVQQVCAENSNMRVNLVQTRYKIQPGASLGRREITAIVDQPAEEGETLRQSEYVQRGFGYGYNLSDLLVFLSDSYAPFLPFLQAAAWEPVVE